MSRIKAYQCDICDKLDVDDVTDKKFAELDYGHIAEIQRLAAKHLNPSREKEESECTDKGEIKPCQMK